MPRPPTNAGPAWSRRSFSSRSRFRDSSLTTRCSPAPAIRCAGFSTRAPDWAASGDPLLVQLPPSLEFDARRVGRFLALLRVNHDGPVVCEPRHVSWTSAAATALLTQFRIARAAADPPRAAGLSEPAGWPGLIYYRMHGSPRPYFSPYSPQRMAELESSLKEYSVPAWCIFDNTGSGSAAGHAVDLTDRLSLQARPA